MGVKLSRVTRRCSDGQSLDHALDLVLLPALLSAACRNGPTHPHYPQYGRCVGCVSRRTGGRRTTGPEEPRFQRGTRQHRRRPHPEQRRKTDPPLFVSSAPVSAAIPVATITNSAVWWNSSIPPLCCMTMSSTMPISAEAAEPREKSGAIKSVFLSATTSIPKPSARSSDFQNQGINEVLAEACRKMAEGEVLQLYYNGNPPCRNRIICELSNTRRPD